MVPAAGTGHTLKMGKAFPAAGDRGLGEAFALHVAGQDGVCQPAPCAPVPRAPGPGEQSSEGVEGFVRSWISPLHAPCPARGAELQIHSCEEHSSRSTAVRSTAPEPGL